LTDLLKSRDQVRLRDWKTLIRLDPSFVLKRGNQDKDDKLGGRSGLDMKPKIGSSGFSRLSFAGVKPTPGTICRSTV